MNSCVSCCFSPIQHSNFDPLVTATFQLNMSQMSVVLFVCVGLMSPSTMARIHLNEGPLFSTATSFTLELTTTTLTKQTPCYITSGDVSQCRRKRGIEESPQISDIIASSAVVGYIRQTKNFLFLILNY